ncbi:MAG: potassium transporter TrkA [Haloferacaceae archaeon]
MSALAVVPVRTVSALAGSPAPVDSALPVQTGSALPVVAESLVRFVAGVAGFALVAATVAAVAALVHRWYTREPVPQGVTVLLGLGAVALYLNSTTALQQVIGGGGASLFELEDVLRNAVTFSVAALATPVGRAVGDRVATDLFAIAGGRQLEGEVSRIVRSVGGVTAVTLPEEIDDMEAYDPVPPEVTAELAGKTLLFPGRLTVEELRDRFVTRVKTDYGVGYVDVEFTDRGDVEYLALGSRVAGLGPTLAPGTVATAIRADPAHSASPGDVVQVWTGPPDPRPLARAELRATAGDVVTLALDEADAGALDPAEAYRLVTLPAWGPTRQDREFASLLRNAEETMGVLTVAEESDLAARTVGDLDVPVVAVRSVEGEVEAIPSRARALTPGEQVYVVGRPDDIRRLEERAGSPAPEASLPADT